MRGNVEVGAVASVGTEFSCQQPDESKLGPLTNPEGPEQLLLGVVDGKRDGVRGGDWQRVPRGARGFRSKVLRIAAGSKSNRRESWISLEEGGTLPKASDTTLERAINREGYDFESYRTR